MNNKQVKRIGITFCLPEELRRKFKVKLAGQNNQMASVLRQWIEAYVAP